MCDGSRELMKIESCAAVQREEGNSTEIKHLLPEGKCCPLAACSSSRLSENRLIGTWIVRGCSGILISSSSISRAVCRLCFIRFFSVFFFRGSISSQCCRHVALSVRKETLMPVLESNRAMPRSTVRLSRHGACVVSLLRALQTLQPPFSSGAI